MSYDCRIGSVTLLPGSPPKERTGGQSGARSLFLSGRGDAETPDAVHRLFELGIFSRDLE
jgi:hypothetical protein